MPATHFICPDKETIPIDACLSVGGCRMGARCATLPYLRLAGFDREWRGITPSMAGTGPRAVYLKAVTPYAIDPNDRAFAALGTGTHDKLSIHKYTHNVLSEQELSDDDMRGIADVLERDEVAIDQDLYVLTDYKTWGSYKLAKSLGLIKITHDDPILDSDGNPVLLKSGKNKGKPKTKQRHEFKIDSSKIDMRETILQLNRYRMFFNQYFFNISCIKVQAIPRDGSTYIAKSRGIDKNIYMIQVPIIPDADVTAYYTQLDAEVAHAFKSQYARICTDWESWDQRRCDGYCEVADACKAMEVQAA